MSTIVFPAGGRRLVERMCEKFPDLHVNVDEKQRELTKRINEQMKFQFGARWGGKVRAGLDPVIHRSKDSQAFDEGNGFLSTWDLFQGNAEATILVQDRQPPTHPDISPADGTFIEVVARDWLEGAEPETEPNTEPPDSELEDRVAMLEAEVNQLQVTVQALQAKDAQQAGQITNLEARLAVLEASDAKPMKVIGRTEASLGHQHQVNLFVTRQG
jgi:hypothetical protein